MGPERAPSFRTAHAARPEVSNVAPLEVKEGSPCCSAGARKERLDIAPRGVRLPLPVGLGGFPRVLGVVTTTLILAPRARQASVHPAVAIGTS